MQLRGIEERVMTMASMGSREDRESRVRMELNTIHR